LHRTVSKIVMIRFPNDEFWFIVDMICSIFSIFGSIYLIKSCAKSSRQENPAVKFVLATGLATLLFSAANILSAYQPTFVGTSNTNSCMTEAILRQISCVFTIIFSTCLAIIASKAATSNRDFNCERYFGVSAFLGLFIGVLLCSGPVFLPKYIIFSNGPLYCWIGPDFSDSNKQKLIIVLIYQALPVLISSIITLVSYFSIKKGMRNLSESLSKSDIRTSTLWWYPVALFISLIPGIIYVIWEFYRPAAIWSKFMHLALPHSIGFTYAILYGIQEKLYSEENEYNSSNESSRENPHNISLMKMF